MSGIKDFGESAAKSVLERIGRGVSRVQERKPLPYDLLESDEAYLVVFDAPGVQRSDVQVRFLEGEVQVQIDRFRDFHEGFEMRFPGRGLSLDGSVTLPDAAVVDATEATATLAENGTLRVRIPKDGRAHEVAVTEEDEETATEDEESAYEPSSVEETVAESEGETVGDGDSLTADEDE
jgi:HSP20 family molecular chaperone IbpA